MKTYKVTFWTDQTHPTGDPQMYERTELVIAKNEFDAIYESENRHPDWAIIGSIAKR